VSVATKDFFRSIEVLENEHSVASSFRGQGNFEFTGNMRFSGEWKGSIQSRGEGWAHLQILKGSQLSGHIVVDEISVEGELHDVSLEVKVFRALPGCRIFGRICAERVVIDIGAFVQGRIVSSKKTAKKQLKSS